MPWERAGAAASSPTSSWPTASAASQPRPLGLLQKRIEEAVMPFVRKQLARRWLFFDVDGGKSHAGRVRVTLQELRYLLAIFLVKHGTGRVQQFTTMGQRLPQRAQQAFLLARELRDVALAPQPLDVRVPARDARGAARHVGEDAVERRAVPPRRRHA